MQFGFEEVSEKEQESNRKYYKFDRKMKKIYNIAIYVVLGILSLALIGIAIKALVEGDVSRFWYIIKMLLGFAIPIIMTYAVLEWIFKLLDRSLEYNPEKEKGKIDKMGALSLSKLLSKMTDNVGLIISNVMCGCIVVTILLVMICYPEFTFEHILWVLGITGIVDMLCIFIHSRRNYIKSILKHTKRVYEIEDENAWKQAIDCSVQNGLLYCSSRLSLTTDYIISSLGTDVVFCPVAIPRNDIVAAEYYTKVMTSARNNSYVGILACKLKNGKVVNLYIGRNGAHGKACQALDYYGFSYVKNKEMRY